MTSDKGKEKKEPGFADDLTDGRDAGQWQTRYSAPEAKSAIRKEAIYLACILLFYFIFLVLLILDRPQYSLGLSGETLKHFNLCIGAWLAGTIGGTLFAMKWLYHTVAHNYWNIDRRLWRFFSPHISGVLGLLLVLIVSSGLFGFFDPSAVDKLPLVIGLAFLTGYFSDSAIAKLAEIASTVFGKAKEHGGKE
jgi:hypothetical protein